MSSTPFSVGPGEAQGMTDLIIGHNGMSITTSMGVLKVRQLINLLEAAISDIEEKDHE